ncbi:uncharacterized protein LOC124441589 [Xenia sp. Carnegie-2017]|uniref:uncharacterized protein LOC124441589 n=1 Tax=Xenia sp. Carnegie-2017 TaxID=2897299 RepID=UPI001F03FB30|nr:uncharacterized protein LOC124441589 [Xenia sp. Carnegie-2017]
MAAINFNSTSSFMEEVQKYDCLYNKFSKYYKNRRTRENAWEKIAEKFGLTSLDAEKKYKNIRTSYVRYLKKMKNVPSGSGRDAVPIPGEFANLEWLKQHISHRKSSSNLPNHESSDEEEIIDTEDMNTSSCSIARIDDANLIDVEVHNTDSPESFTATTPGSTSTGDLEEIPSKNQSLASSSKRKRPWATSNRQKGGKSKDVDMAMLEIAGKLLQEPTPNTSEDDEYMHFAKSFAKRLRKLPERAQGYVRIQLERLMFEAEFEALPQQLFPPAGRAPMHMGFSQAVEYPSQYVCNSTSNNNLHPL